MIRDNMPQGVTVTFTLEDGTILHSQTLARKGPSNPFSTGAVGYASGKPVTFKVNGRVHNVGLNIIEADTKGVFAATQTPEDAWKAQKAEYFRTTYEVSVEEAERLAQNAWNAKVKADADKAAKKTAK